MSYRSNIKNLLMKGRMFRSKGQGLAGGPALPRLRLGFRHTTGGTISHKAIIDSISHGKGISQQAVTGSILSSLDRIHSTRKKGSKKASRKGSKKASKKASKGKGIKKVSAKKTKKKSSKNFKSLKFNF